jgi:hypothetical protein
MVGSGQSLFLILFKETTLQFDTHTKLIYISDSGKELIKNA